MVPGCRAYDDPQGVIDRADLVFITTPDDAIAPTVARLRWRPGQGVVHCSGADSLDILEPARKMGAQVGAIHPLQSFASSAQALENLPGSTFALEGQGELLEKLKVDDALAVWGVHGIGGTWGALATGLFVGVGHRGEERQRGQIGTFGPTGALPTGR